MSVCVCERERCKVIMNRVDGIWIVFTIGGRKEDVKNYDKIEKGEKKEEKTGPSSHLLDPVENGSSFDY